MADQEEIFTKVTEIVRDLFDEYDGPVTLKTNANDIEEWDSLSHVRLMVMIEMEFGVKFSTSEMQGFNDLGDLVETVAKHRA